MAVCNTFLHNLAITKGDSAAIWLSLWSTTSDLADDISQDTNLRTSALQNHHPIRNIIRVLTDRTEPMILERVGGLLCKAQIVCKKLQNEMNWICSHSRQCHWLTASEGGAASLTNSCTFGVQSSECTRSVDIRWHPSLFDHRTLFTAEVSLWIIVPSHQANKILHEVRALPPYLRTKLRAWGSAYSRGFFFLRREAKIFAEEERRRWDAGLSGLIPLWPTSRDFILFLEWWGTS